jgi:hypothetical protein
VPQVRYGLFGHLELHGDCKFRFIQFKLPRFRVYQVVCDVFEGENRLAEAMECFRKAQSEMLEDTLTLNDRSQWELGA